MRGVQDWIYKTIQICIMMPVETVFWKLELYWLYHLFRPLFFLKSNTKLYFHGFRNTKAFPWLYKGKGQDKGELKSVMVLVLLKENSLKIHQAWSVLKNTGEAMTLENYYNYH